MADESWKTKFMRDLKNERKLAIAQIELDKKLHAENIQKLKEIEETLIKLGEKNESI
jgi:hypothetical protein